MKNRHIKQLIETNNQIVTFLDYLKEEYPFKDEEKEALDNFAKHMSNMNLIFGKIKK